MPVNNLTSLSPGLANPSFAAISYSSKDNRTMLPPIKKKLATAQPHRSTNGDSEEERFESTRKRKTEHDTLNRNKSEKSIKKSAKRKKRAKKTTEVSP